LKDNEASTWFAQVYKKFHQPFSENSNQTLGEKLGMIDLLQKPGETVFIPGGWHHIVMNLKFSIAITQNFCSETNLEYVWLKTRFSRPKMARKLKSLLKQKKNNLGNVKIRHPKRCNKRIRCLKTVPSLPTSSSDFSSSSTTDSETDSDQSVICQCHGNRRRSS
jgi:histone arginine demethylase JMJD6